MDGSVDTAYDKVAQLYADLFDDLNRVPGFRDRLEAFAAHASGQVLDVGCGPGHVTNHLVGLGLDVLGYDISSRMVAEARERFPVCRFGVGDLTALPHEPRSVGAILARHSLIHLDPIVLPMVFEHWAGLLAPGAPVMVTFFAADEPVDHGRPFGHTVTTAYQLSPTVVAGQLETAGFVVLETSTRPPLEGERPMNHGSILARRPQETP